MSWKKEYETKCDAYELNIDEVTGKKKWTKRGINGDLIIYSHSDNLHDLKVRFELFTIQIWWKVFNPKLKKKGSKTRVVTFKRLSTKEQTKETIALRFKNPQICQSFIAKWESLTRDIEYETTDSEDEKDDKQEEEKDNKQDDEKYGDNIDDKKLEIIADKSSFRDLIQINLLPDINLINSSLILNEYYFNYYVIDKIKISSNNEINYANYSYGKYNNEEHYLSIWMNSEVLKRVFYTQYKRPKCNMIICLDKSESMNESLCINEGSRMEIAQEALCQLFRHSLDKQDRFAIITFNDKPIIEWPLTLIDSLPYGMLDLRRDITKFKCINGRGNRNLEKAYKKVLTNILTEQILYESQRENIYNRIIFITDLVLNINKIKQYNSPKGIFGMIRTAAEKNNIYTTFLSISVEQNEKLLYDSLSNIRGCNYLCVKTKTEFINKFDKEKEFPYMITPILYDLDVGLNTNIQQVYTSSNNTPINGIRNGQLLAIKSMFGNLNYSQPLIIKFNYKKNLKLNISFIDKNNKKNQSQQTIDLTFKTEDIDDIYDSNQQD
eukprot:518300_1